MKQWFYNLNLYFFLKVYALSYYLSANSNIAAYGPAIQHQHGHCIIIPHSYPAGLIMTQPPREALYYLIHIGLEGKFLISSFILLTIQL